MKKVILLLTLILILFNSDCYSQYSIKIHSIECIELSEAGDEIFISVGGNKLKALQDNEFYNFIKKNEVIYVNLFVGKVDEQHPLKLSLIEKDKGDSIFNDLIGTVNITIEHNQINFKNVTNTIYTRTPGRFQKVYFHGSDGNYCLNFEVIKE